MDLLTTGGAVKGQVELPAALFDQKGNDSLVWASVKCYLANQRQGTHKSKDRSEISLSTRKIKRQKGTGGARAGSLKSPVFIGGGRSFGPKPRDYSFKLNKKVKQLARLSALAYKAKSNNVVVVEDFSLEAPKTKDFVQINKNLKIDDKKSLLVLTEQNKTIYLSSRNLKGKQVVTLSDLNTYDIMNASVLVFMESSINLLQNSNN